MWSELLLLILASIFLDHVAIATGRADGLPPYQSHGGPLLPGQDAHGGIPMGVRNNKCDDGQTNLTIDWDGSIDDYQCLSDKWTSNRGTHTAVPNEPQCTKDFDHPTHICMSQSITYHDVIPTSGAHRPLWAKYGEYRFLPKQRWVHNLEHGAAVLLYHPCADPRELTRIKRIVGGCMRKHIITPFKELTRDMPFAVLTYGCKLELPYVDAGKIRSFLRQHANKAPERRVSQDGQFDDQLTGQPAKTVSNWNDCEICPQTPFEQCPMP